MNSAHGLGFLQSRPGHLILQSGIDGNGQRASHGPRVDDVDLRHAERAQARCAAAQEVQVEGCHRDRDRLRPLDFVSLQTNRRRREFARWARRDPLREAVPRRNRPARASGEVARLAAFAFIRTSSRTQPGSIFSQSNCSTSTAAAAPAGAASCQRGGKAVAGPQFGDPTRLDFFPADCAQGRGKLDLRAARRHAELKPRGGHAGNRQVEAGGAAARLHGRPQRQFQAILARLGDLQEQSAAVRFPFGLHGTIVELGLARLQADLFAAQGDPHAGRRR